MVGWVGEWLGDAWVVWVGVMSGCVGVVGWVGVTRHFAGVTMESLSRGRFEAEALNTQHLASCGSFVSLGSIKPLRVLISGFPQ